MIGTLKKINQDKKIRNGKYSTHRPPVSSRLIKQLNFTNRKL